MTAALGVGCAGIPWCRRKRGFASVSWRLRSSRGSRRPRGGRAGRERVRAVAAVPVGRQHVGEAVADELDRPGVRLGTLAAEQRAHVDLQERTGGDLLLEHLVAAGEEAGGALRVRDHEREAVVADVPAGGEEGRVDARERHLEQHPAGAGRAVGDHVELGRAERGRAVGVDLAARVDAQLDAGGVELRLERARALGDGRDVEREPRDADVRRHGGLVDAVAGELLGVDQARGQVRWSVVHPWQQVEVQVDMGHVVVLSGGSSVSAHGWFRLSSPP